MTDESIEFTPGPPVSGDVYAQNRKLLVLLRGAIEKLDDLDKYNFDSPRYIADWLEAEVSAIVFT